MSDVAAIGLGEWFLVDPPRRAVEAIVEILQGDPPLALWVALKADRLVSAPPQTLGDLAAALVEHGLAWLQWETEPAPVELDAATREELAARVAVAVVVSQAAAELAAVHGEDAAGQARLVGLLRDPAQWLVALQQSGGGQSACLPRWLSPSHFPPAVFDAVEQAVRAMDIPPGSCCKMLSNKLPSPSGRGAGGEGDLRSGAASGGHIDAITPHPSSLPEGEGDHFALPGKLAVSSAYLRRGVEAASRWAGTHRAARWLGELTAKLARLAAWERSFSEAVETGKIAAMAEFAAGAGHELNNPLAVIAGRAQLLLQDETDPERRSDLALMNAQAMRVHEMIADLRLFASPPELERQSLDLAALVGRVVDEVRPLATRQETVLVFTAGRSPVRVEADPVQLTVAMKALCQNSLEALGHRGRIEIAVDGDGGEASIVVADDGPGISPEQRPHIFEPFYSARQAKRGVGMGLSKCWRIVTGHGGRIEVACRARVPGTPGGGAVFTIRLPSSL